MRHYVEWKNWTESDFGVCQPTDHAYFRKLQKHFPEKITNCLEIGFGNGSFLGFMIEQGVLVEGVEMLEVLLARARANGIRCYGSIKDIPKDQKYDLVCLFDVLEHIPQAEIELFLTNIATHLSPNGRILIRTPNGSSPLGLANQYGDVTHQTVITTSKLNYWGRGIRVNSESLRLVFSGADPYPIYNGQFLKTPSRAVKYALRRILENFCRWVFAPQSEGLFSPNLLSVFKFEA